MRNTAKFYNKLLEDIELNLDTVVMIIKVREEVGEHLLELFFMTGVAVTVAPVLANDSETFDEARDRILSQWRHGHGRPEIIEVFSDTEGPKSGYGRELLDLSACVTFSCRDHFMWGPEITCRFAMKDAQTYAFILKRDESVTADEQCANVETLWRKARGEANV